MADFVTANLVASFLQFTVFGVFLLLSSASLALLTRRHHAAFGNTPFHEAGVHRAPSKIGARSLHEIGMRIWSFRHSPMIIANVLIALTVIAVS